MQETTLVREISADKSRRGTDVACRSSDIEASFFYLRAYLARLIRLMKLPKRPEQSSATVTSVEISHFIGSFKTIRIAATRYRDRAVTSPSICPEMFPQMHSSCIRGGRGRVVYRIIKIITFVTLSLCKFMIIIAQTRPESTLESRGWTSLEEHETETSRRGFHESGRETR